jgi:hypothetical protein
LWGAAGVGGGYAEGWKSMNRGLVSLGAILVVVGLLWPWVRKFHLFHLPGDFVIDRVGFRLFLPITTMVILSVALSVVAWLLRR